ncbi:hypothetical protein BDR05DRAFT_1005822 [Suillus weaverae]|nr:hypothetical protein BDR05DRAFT_1005822 [Suillus weaverae]
MWFEPGILNPDSLSELHLSGPDTNNKSPKDLRLLGQVQFGVYQDGCEGIHPDIIEEYYGIYGHVATRWQHQTGVGHPMDEEDSDDGKEPQDIAQAVNNQQRDHVHHEAIGVLLQRNPFVNEGTYQQFSATLTEVVAEDITPCHCRLAADEWEGNGYPVFETISIGRRGLKELHVLLGELIWFRQAKLWCQAESNNEVIFCRGVKADSQPCDCEEFFAQSQDKGHCVECGHGRSKHPHKVSDYRPEGTVQDEPQPSSSAAIKEIFDQVAGGRSINDKPSATRRGSLSLTAAWDKAISTLSSTRLAGYNKLAKGPVPSAGLRKDHKETNPYPPSQVCRNTASNSATAATATMFRVASIAMLTCGTDKSGLIRETKAPGRSGQNEIQAMRNHGCYLDQQFRIDSRWSYAKITNNLRTWFPKVFKYLDTQVKKQTSQPWSSHEEKPIWCLLNKSGQTLKVVNIAFPTGSDLSKHKG